MQAAVVPDLHTGVRTAARYTRAAGSSGPGDPDGANVAGRDRVSRPDAFRETTFVVLRNRFFINEKLPICK